MRVFKTKLFARFVRKSSIDDTDLCRAVDEIAAGSIDAQLGSGIFKQRIARLGGGKSGGFRTIVLFRHQSQAFFVFGFAKKDIANIDQEQLQHFRKLAEFLLAQSSQQLDEALAQGKLFEVEYAKKTI
jgi:hypothetical protein